MRTGWGQVVTDQQDCVSSCALQPYMAEAEVLKINQLRIFKAGTQRAKDRVAFWGGGLNVTSTGYQRVE